MRVAEGEGSGSFQSEGGPGAAGVRKSVKDKGGKVEGGIWEVEGKWWRALDEANNSTGGWRRGGLRVGL